eukprot:m.71344 g.71344  ORF g.71344 m.71344 type:complete len:272 (+) comp24339_c0_seq1:133-948(+)
MFQAMWNNFVTVSSTVSNSILGENVSNTNDATNRDRMLLTIAFCLTHTACTFGLTFFYEGLSKMKLFQQYRVQAGNVTPKVLKQLWTEAIVDHVLMQWVFVYFILSRIYESTGALEALTKLETPGMATHVAHLTVAVLLEDLMFYWLHRGLKRTSSTINNEHHKVTINHPLAFQHANMFEKLCVNSVAFWVPAMFLNMHGSTFVLWTMLQICESIEAQSGYKLPFSPLGFSRCGDRRSSPNKRSRSSWFETMYDTCVATFTGTFDSNPTFL